MSSLFPIINSNENVPTSTASNFGWLQNKSFGISAQLEAKRIENIVDEDAGQSSEAAVTAVKVEPSDERHRKKYKAQKRKHKHHRSSRVEEKKVNIAAVVEQKLSSLQAEVTAAAGKVFIEEVPGLTPETAYRIDKTADRNNAVYGSLYRMHIAKHRRISEHYLGGSGVGIREKKVKEAVVRYYSRGTRSDIARAGEKVSVILPASNSLDFLELASNVANSSVAVDGAEDINMTAEEVQRRAKMTSYSQRLQAEPHNIALWLDFIRYQDSQQVVGRSAPARNVGEVEEQKMTERSLYEMKEAIFARALEKNPGNVELMVAQLGELQNYWETDRQSAEWKKLLFSHVNDAKLWRQYLTFQRTKFASFSVSRLVRDYARCIASLRGVLEGKQLSYPAQPGTRAVMIDIVAELCHILKQAGHSEKAVALIQAMLDFNLHLPAVLLSATLDDQLDFFEAFWDAPQCPARFGEDGSVGWGRWVEEKGDGIASVIPWIDREIEGEREEALLQQHRASRSGVWLALEHSRGQRQWQPFRPCVSKGETEEACEDAERLIVADDIKKFIFQLATPTERAQMVCRCLELFGVDVSAVVEPTAVDLFSDGLDHVVDRPVFGRACVDSWSLLEKRKAVVVNILKQSLSHFEGHWKTFFVIKLCNTLQTCEPLKNVKKWLKSVLKEKENRDCMALYEQYALLEWRDGGGNEARRIMDTALSMQAGLLSRAEFMSADDLASDAVCSACKLVRIYASVELGLMSIAGSNVERSKVDSGVTQQKTLAILLRMFSKPGQPETNSSATAILKQRRVLEQLLERTLQATVVTEQFCLSLDDLSRLANCGHMISHLTWCLACLLYVTSGIGAASVVYSQVTAQLAAHISTGITSHTLLDHLHHEIVCDHVRLLQHHASTSMASLDTLRSVLASALLRYPSDSKLVAAYVGVEERTVLAHSMRRVFHRLVRDSRHSILPWIHVVLAEHDRVARLQQHALSVGMPPAQLQDTGLVHQLRAWLEMAVTSGPASHSPLIWRLYLLLEMTFGSKLLVKAVFYRALQLCPWAKSIYMDYVTYDPDQLQEVVDLIVEKELRLRTPVEEVDLLLASRRADVAHQSADGDTPVSHRLPTSPVVDTPSTPQD